LSRSEPEPLAGLSDAQARVVLSFKQAHRSLRRRTGRETHGPSGEISQAQLELLIELRKRGPMAVGELAQVSGLSPASVSQMVDRLSEQGHVNKLRSEEDRRVVELELSEEGRATVEPIIERWRQRWREALAEIPEKELAAASRVLDRIAWVYEETPD
jgi:DNA-binding MarR family transcriptional regulator